MPVIPALRKPRQEDGEFPAWAKYQDLVPKKKKKKENQTKTKRSLCVKL
jgi:hypothetical protein